MTAGRYCNEAERVAGVITSSYYSRSVIHELAKGPEWNIRHTQERRGPHLEEFLAPTGTRITSIAIKL